MTQYEIPTADSGSTSTSAPSCALAARTRRCISVGPTQINAQVPFEVRPGDSVPVAINVGGLLTTPQNYLIAPVQPAIFSVNQSGSGQGAILDAQFQLVDVGNPAAVGEVVQIFATPGWG